MFRAVADARQHQACRIELCLAAVAEYARQCVSIRVCSDRTVSALRRLWITFIVFAITFVVFAVRLRSCAAPCKSLLVCTSQSCIKRNAGRELMWVDDFTHRSRLLRSRPRSAQMRVSPQTV